MPSREVNTAVGEAPAQETARAQLAQKQAELRRTEQKLTAAEEALDVSRVVRLQAEADVLRQFITRLEVEALREGEGEARTEAEVLIKRKRAAYTAALDELDPAVERAREAIKAGEAACLATYDTWSEAGRLRREVELLALRFGLDGPTLAPLPDPPNLVAILLDADLRPHLVRQPRPPVIPHSASDPPEVIARRAVEGVTKYVARHRASLSPEVRALFDRAPVPRVTPAALPEQRADPVLEAAAQETAAIPPSVPAARARVHRG